MVISFSDWIICGKSCRSDGDGFMCSEREGQR